MAEDTALNRTVLELELLLPEIDDGDGCGARLQERLAAVRGVSHAHIDRAGPKACLCIHYDPATVSLAALQRVAVRQGAEISARYRHEIIAVEGMDCSDCTLAIEHGIGRMDGVLTAVVSYAAATLRVEYDGTRVRRPAIVARLNALGYRVPKEGVAAFLEERRELVFSGLSGALLAAGWTVGWLGGAPGWLPDVLFASAYLFGGWDVARHAWHALRERQLDTDLLMIVAALGAAAIGRIDDGALLLFLFSLGHALEEMALDRARDAVRKLGDLTPRTALVRRSAGEVEVGVEEIALDEVVVARPGVRLAVDGLVVGGRSAVDQAPVTGESVPVEKAPGDKVFAGTVNGEGALEVRVTRLARDSTLSRVMRLVEEAQSRKTRTQQTTERFTRWFVPSVLVGAVLVMVVPTLFGVPFTDAFLRAMTLLVAASPCALALGTPAAMLAGIAQAARNGLLIKGGVHLETLGALQVVAFDKTGTLTVGRPELTDVVAIGDPPLGEDRLLALVAAVESRSAHPLGQAVARAARARGLALPDSTGVVSVTGRGVRSSVGGVAVLIGSASLLGESGVPVAPEVRSRAAALEGEGKTTMMVALDGRVGGLLALADTPRPGAAAALGRLRSLGVERTLLLTGDNQAVGERVARLLGVDEVRAGLMPEDKVAAIRELAAERTVAMIGDGVNDAPALAAASVGIAMGGAGTDVALETADVALMGDDLAKLPFAVELGRATRAVVRQNLFVAAGVIAALLATSVAGVTGIGTAIVLHEGSTLVVALNALRLLALRPRPE